MRPCSWSSGSRHDVISSVSANVASMPETKIVSSLTASQRRRVTLCVHASRNVPCSNSSTSGAAKSTPNRPGRKLSQGMIGPACSKRCRKSLTMPPQPAPLAAVCALHAATPSSAYTEAMCRPSGTSVAAATTTAKAVDFIGLLLRTASETCPGRKKTGQPQRRRDTEPTAYRGVSAAKRVARRPALPADCAGGRTRKNTKDR